MLACDFIYRFVTSRIFFSIILIPDFDIDLIVNEEDEEKRKSRQCIVITIHVWLCTLLSDYIFVNAIYRRSVRPVSGSVIKFHPHHTRGRRAFPSLMAQGTNLSPALPHISVSIWEHLAQNHTMFSKLLSICFSGDDWGHSLKIIVNYEDDYLKHHIM